MVFSACSSPAYKHSDSGSPHPEAPLALKQELLPHPDAAGKRIELFWAVPEGQGPWPVIVAIHGHQEGKRPGATIFPQHWYRRMLNAGLIAVAVSQPGYGNSNGPPDYCGPFTQHAVQAVIQYLRKLPYVDRERIGLHGISRGAIVASKVASLEPDLKALILQVGIYDLADSYRRLSSSRSGKSGAYDKIVKNIAQEAGTTELEFSKRSVLQAPSNIRASTLILTSENDFPGSREQAYRLKTRLESIGTPVQLVDFQGEGHFIPFEKRDPVIDAFLKTALHGKD